jgi:hypothetical protein
MPFRQRTAVDGLENDLQETNQNKLEKCARACTNVMLKCNNKAKVAKNCSQGKRSSVFSFQIPIK